jgi:hypothetical protein
MGLFPKTELKLRKDTRDREDHMEFLTTEQTVKCPICNHVFQPEGLGASFECGDCSSCFCAQCFQPFTGGEEDHFCLNSVGQDCNNAGCGHLDNPYTCRLNFPSAKAMRDHLLSPHLKIRDAYNLLLIAVESKKRFDVQKDTGGSWRCQPFNRHFLLQVVRKFLV